MGKIDSCMTLCDVINTIESLDEMFDSHEFIDAYSKMFPTAYQGLKSSYTSVDGAHKLIGKYLSKYRQALSIDSIGRSYSINVLGRKNECELWRKVKVG